MLPIHGFGLAVDASALQSATPPLAGRERVDQDMHIYIDGNRESSGDGLSPETAVKTTEEAFLALSRYDGCNVYDAHLHFTSLQNDKAEYSAMNIYPGTYATFKALFVSGEFYGTTHIGICTMWAGCNVTFTDICLNHINNVDSFTTLKGEVAFRPTQAPWPALFSQYGGAVCLRGGKLYFHGGSYEACIAAHQSAVYAMEPVQVHTLGPITVEHGFLRANCGSTIGLDDKMDFSGCTAVTGRHYSLNFLSSLYGQQNTVLPGTQDGILLHGSVCA